MFEVEPRVSNMLSKGFLSLSYTLAITVQWRRAIPHYHNSPMEEGYTPGHNSPMEKDDFLDKYWDHWISRSQGKS